MVGVSFGSQHLTYSILWSTAVLLEQGNVENVGYTHHTVAFEYRHYSSLDADVSWLPGKAMFIYQIHICVYFRTVGVDPCRLFSHHMWFCLSGCNWKGRGEGEGSLGNQWWEVRAPGILPRAVEPSRWEWDAKRLVNAWSSVFAHRDLR